MRRTWALLAALCIIAMTVPGSAGQLADPEANVSSSEPVNQTTSLGVVAHEDGTTTITVTTEGEIVNETASVTLPDDAISTVDHVLGLVLWLANNAVDLVEALCNAVVGLLGHYRCASL